MSRKNLGVFFAFFSELGIINQLATSLFNKQMPEGLHVSHFAVLNHMMRLGDGQTPVALASAFQVSKGTMTHTLTALETRGLIALTPNEADGRSKLARLTEQGRDFHARAIDSLSPAVAALQGKLDVAQMERMLPALAEIRAVLDANR